MGILTKDVEIRPTGKSIKYYKDKGYNAAHLKPIMVKVEDLPEHSDRVVEILCDYCKENIIFMKYSTYRKGAKNIEKHACKNCRYEKIKEVTQKLYGVECIGSLPEVKEKRDKTILERYDVDCYSKTETSKEKSKVTSLIKYGFDNPSKSPLISKKRKETNLQKFGYEYNLQSPIVRKQIEDTCLSKYGCINVSQVPEIRKKVSEVLYKNSTAPTSRQQIYLYNLYNINGDVELNYPVSYYNTDICLSKEKIICEYDGSGHNLSVKMGDISQEEFDRKEIIRSFVVKQEGYKTMRIISYKDRLPSDQVLFQMLSDAKHYFQTTQHTWVSYDIDKSLLFNAESPHGTPYNFGSLRTIKESDLNAIKDNTTTAEQSA